jgi:uncharacterized glyoxalase superfamily protein PhnB
MPSKTFTAPDIVPFMRYSDALAGIEWLNQVLGFETLTLYEGPGGSVAHAVLRFGSGALQISSPRGNEVARPDHTMGLGGLYLVVDDPDALYVRAKAAGGDIVWELTDEEYGSREFSVRDPEGNVWSLGTYRPGSS